MSDLTEPILMTEDPLEDLKRFLLLDVMVKNKKLFLFLIKTLIVLGIMLTVFYLYYQKPNLHDTLVTILMVSPGISNSIVVVFLNLSLDNTPNFHNGWSTNQFDNITTNRIKKVSKWLYYCIISNFILIVLMNLFTFNISFEVEENDYVFLLIKTVFGKFYIVPFVIVTIYFCLLGYPSVWWCSFIAYITFEAGFQNILMAAYVNNLKKYQTNDNSIQDEVYQLEIQRTLIKSVEHQVTIRKFVCISTENKYSVYLTLGMLSGGFSYTLMCGYCLLGEETYSKHDIRVELRLFFATLILIANCVIDQYRVDTCLEFYNSLCNTDWYYWNESNKKALLIMLQYNMEPMKGMRIANSIKFDYPFILTWLRVAYQATAVFINVRNKK